MENIPANVPLLLTINHPNSFLDAVLVGAYLNRSTYFLARGDAFQNKIILPVLKALHMLPVYRLSEGKNNLSKNTETFDACQAILKERKIVLIFAEGLSENNWELRSLKKGPARIALKAWNSNTPAKELQVIPIGLTYEHYSGGGKNILINIGKPVTAKEFPENDSEAFFVKTFNQKISVALIDLIYINKDMIEDTPFHHKFRAKFQQLVKENKSAPEVINGLHELSATATFSTSMRLKQTLLFWPLYAACGNITKQLIKSKLFFDSISFGLFLFLWPVYLLLILLVLSVFL
ncbi:MAG: 1-acyl-sn-glycerol-3-phosphate acyltransferase [Bacteroidia bacterium]|nr:1-acyl-sn-glycerol-3-phosphate acyltransferase [Bacteroidia bacterium]